MRVMPIAMALGALVLVACASPTEDDTREVLGVIAGHTSEDPRITVVVTGHVVEVSVITYGPGCYEAARTETRLRGSRIEVSPYDRRPPEGTPCTTFLRQLEHTVRVTLDETGEYQVVIRGIRRPAGDTIEVERSISVGS